MLSKKLKLNYSALLRWRYFMLHIYKKIKNRMLWRRRTEISCRDTQDWFISRHYIALTITRFELNVRGSAPCFHVIACEYVKLLLWFSVVCTINRRATRPVVHSFILSVRLIRLIDEFLFIAICVHTLDSTRLNSTASTSFCSTGCT